MGNIIFIALLIAYAFSPLIRCVVHNLGRIYFYGIKDTIMYFKDRKWENFDYYGIDMSSMEQFIAFRAAIELLKEQGREDIIAKAYQCCKAQEYLPKKQMRNYVKTIYEPFTDEQISLKTAQLLTPESTQADVKIIYQTLAGLHEACPEHTGDWYFSGNYPTFGGLKLLNKAFIDYIGNEKSDIDS